MNNIEKYLARAPKIIKAKKVVQICTIVSITTFILSIILLNLNRTTINTYLNTVSFFNLIIIIGGYSYYKLFTSNLQFYIDHYDNNPEGVIRKIRLSTFGIGLCIFSAIICILILIMMVIYQ